MSTPEFYLEGTSLSPEDQIRENQRLNAIDHAQNVKAKQALSEIDRDDDELRLIKDETVYELSGFAEESAKQLIETIDPFYEHASNIIVSEIISKPSRFLFMTRQVAVYEKRELAAWRFYSKAEGFLATYLGRDGVMYARSYDGQNTVYKKIDLPALDIENLELLEDGLEDTMGIHRRLKES
jgi:hypothetical protein